MRSTQKPQADFLFRVGDPNDPACLMAFLNKESFIDRIGAPEMGSHFNHEARERILRLVRMILELIPTLRKLPPIEEPNLKSRESWPKTLLQWRQRRKLLMPINVALSLYTLRPIVDLPLEGAGQALVTTEFYVEENYKYESIAVNEIRALIRNGKMESLRQCSEESCKKWFMATREQQRWCSQACRQRHFQSTPAFKEKRRENYRARKILAVAKSKKGVAHAKAAK